MAFRRQYELLRRARDCRLLFFASATSGLGTYLAIIALIVDVYDRTHSGAWVSALLIVEFLPILIIGLALGPLVDRLPRRSLMVGADLVRLGVFLALPFAPSALSIVVLAGIAGFATGFFRPAVYAGLPNLVDDRDLPQANGLLLAVDSLAWLVGPLVGGAILAASGPDPSYFVNAATFLASALLLVRISAAKLQQHVAAEGSHLGELREGFHAVRASRALLTVLVAWSIVMIGN